MTGMYTGLQFAKTFDTIYDNQVQEYMVLFAMRTQEWAEAETVRPPLNLLAIPLQAQRWCINWMRGHGPKVLNDGGSQTEAFHQVFKKAADFEHYNGNKVEEWIKVASESKPGTDEDKQGHESLGAYLRAFSDIVVCQPVPLVPENERPVREADSDGSNELHSGLKESTSPTDAVMDFTEAEESGFQPPSNEHRVPRGGQGVARGDSWSDVRGEGKHSVPNEKSVERNPGCAAPHVLGVGSIAAYSSEAGMWVARIREDDAPQRCHVWHVPGKPTDAHVLMAATTTTDADANREHRDDLACDAHAGENCTAAEAAGLPDRQRPTRTSLPVSFYSVNSASASTASAMWLARTRECDAALRCRLWLGHQVAQYVNERGVESSAQEDESWRRVMKKAIIDKIKELGSKTDSKITEIDAKISKLEAKIDAQNGKIDQQNRKIDELIDEVRCVLRTKRSSSKLPGHRTNSLL
jgi:hypothetical protein